MRISRFAAAAAAAAMMTVSCALAAYAASPLSVYEHFYGDVGVQTVLVPEDNSQMHIQTDYKINYVVFVRDDTMAVWTKFDSFTRTTSDALEYAVKDYFTHLTGTDASACGWASVGWGNGSFSLSPAGIAGSFGVDDTWKGVESSEEVYSDLYIKLSDGSGITHVCYGYYSPDIAMDHFEAVDGTN